jgi:hypothetical protein
VSPAAPERHSRVYLDRSYLEVSARPGGSGWSATLFFLRFRGPGVASFEAPRSLLGERLTVLEDDPVAWLDPGETFGLQLGFIEA